MKCIGPHVKSLILIELGKLEHLTDLISSEYKILRKSMEWEAGLYEWMDRGTGITKLMDTSWNSPNMPQNSCRCVTTQEKSKVLTPCMSTKERWYTVSIPTLQILTNFYRYEHKL
jgi:hypothetical protein